MWLGCFGAFKKNDDAACDVFLTLYSFQIFSILTARLKYIAFEFSIKSMWNQFYWGPGPNFNVCVQSSHYQQAILKTPRRGPRIQLNSTQCRHHVQEMALDPTGKGSSHTRPPYTSVSNHKPSLLPELRSYRIHIRGSKDSLYHRMSNQN